MKSRSHSLAPDLQEAIRQRAEEIYIRSGKIPGHDTENWMQAEAEIRREAAQGRSRRPAIVVTVNGVQYVGEYDLDSSGGYSPGEFASGQPLAVRFDGDKMCIQRRNGTELETTIVENKKIG